MAITHKNLRIQAERLLPELLKERLNLHGTEDVEIARTINDNTFIVLSGACTPPCFYVSIPTPDGVFIVCRCPPPVVPK